MRFFRWVSYYWVDIVVTVFMVAVTIGIIWSLVEDSRVCPR
jgi:hypothetical protein